MGSLQWATSSQFSTDAKQNMTTEENYKISLFWEVDTCRTFNDNEVINCKSSNYCHLS